MKSRTMVYLELEQLHLIKDNGVPAASKEAYLKIVGLVSSGKKDISEKHDHYLAKALRREPTR